MPKLAIIAALWMSLKIPFFIIVDDQIIKIRHEELNQQGGITFLHKCSKCRHIDMIDMLVIGNVINLDDLAELDPNS